MNEQSLVELLLNDGKGDKILKSFYPKKTLSPDIFDENKKMNSDIRKKLLSISNNFIDFLGVDFFVHDIVLTGSLASYGWSNFSDVDLHIVIDYDETNHNEELLKQFFDAKKFSWNETYDVKIKGYDVEIYVQDLKEEHTASGIYSILNNKWINTPERNKVDIDENKILQKSNQYMNSIDNIVDKFKDGQDVQEDITKVYAKIKKMRKSGLSTDGEFSYENLVFKYLRRNGYIKKLMDIKTKIINNKLSLKQ